ncbi:glycosyltransferase [Alphaproteobacteria bacterium LSUCC0684]
MPGQGDFSLVQVMAGAENGGAELFFERLAEQFHHHQVDQQIIVKPWPQRVARLRDMGLDVRTNRMRPLLAMLDKAELHNQISKADPGVVLTWMNRATGFVQPGPWCLVGRLGGYYDLKYYRHCDWLVGNTKAIADWLISRGWPKDRVHHQVNFVPEFTGEAASRQAWKTPPDVPLFVAMGRLHRNKGFDTLLDAFARLPGGILWLAGDGPERDALRTHAVNLGILERVRFLGWQDSPLSILAAADIFICPSRHEPFGNVIAEALSARKPVIATSSDGARQILSHGDDGIIVPVDDASALAASMLDMMKDKDLQLRLAVAGHQTWHNSFRPEKVVSDWLDFLQGVQR